MAAINAAKRQQSSWLNVTQINGAARDTPAGRKTHLQFTLQTLDSRVPGAERVATQMAIIHATQQVI